MVAVGALTPVAFSIRDLGAQHAVKDITESTDPIRTQTIAASRGVDVPVWYAIPELNGSMIATQEKHGGLWTGRISPQEFSDIQQAAVVPSGAATPTA